MQQCQLEMLRCCGQHLFKVYFLYKSSSCCVVVIVGPTPPPKNGGGVQQPFLRTPADGIPYLTGIRGRWLYGDPPPFNQQVPHLHGSNKSVTFSCVFRLVQLHKCVVCGSDLQRGHSDDGCLYSSILFKYERSRGHLYDGLLWGVLFQSDVR